MQRALYEFNLHFTNEATEAKEDGVTHPKLPSLYVAESAFEPRSLRPDLKF